MADPEAIAELYRRGKLPPEQAEAYKEAIRRGAVKDPVWSGQTGIGVVDRATAKTGEDQQRIKANQNAAKTAPRKGFFGSVWNDFSEPFANAGRQIGQARQGLKDVNAQSEAAKTPEEKQAALRAQYDQAKAGTAGLTSMVMALPTGLADTFIRPAARGLEAIGIGDEQSNRENFGTALMGLGGPKGVPPRGLAGIAAETKPPVAPLPKAAPAVTGKPTAAQVQAMRVKEAELKAKGVEPSFVDVAGEAGRRRVRAVGVGKSEAGEVLQNRSREVTAATRPAATERTRALVDDPRSADQLVDDIFKARSEAADANYAGPYATQVQLDEGIMSALADEPGKAALRRARQAAVAQQRGDRVAEIDAILSGEPVSVSAGTLDRIKIAMAERAQTSKMRGARDIGAGLQGRASQIDESLEAIPELAAARADYRGKSEALDVLDKGRQDVFSTAPQDYAKWAGGLGEEATLANRVAIRQEILDALGGKGQSRFGTLDDLAKSPYARDNLRAALGREEADSYIGNLDARLEQMRNASFVSPNAGSRTAVLESDLSNGAKIASEGIGLLGQAARGDVPGILQRAAGWAKTFRMSDADAIEVANAVSDPARLPEILAALEAQVGKRTAAAFVENAKRQAQAAMRRLPEAAVTGGAAISSENLPR